MKRTVRMLVGVFAIQVMVSSCTIPLVVTGQATSYHAADDGDLRLGAPFRYQDNGDGTITDLNTGLMWEKKCVDSVSCPAGTNLHNVNNRYDWNEGIWRWIAAVNAENGSGYAGHNDWRIPNLRELQSIVDYGVFQPSIDSTFGPTVWFDCWSSTAHNTADAWAIDFDAGSVHTTTLGRADENNVRAVRGAPSLLATGQRTSYHAGDDGDVKLGRRFCTKTMGTGQSQISSRG